MQASVQPPVASQREAVATVAAPPATPPSGGGASIDPIGSLRKHLRLAVVSMLVILLLGIPVAYKKGEAQYSATAVIFVSPRFLANLEDAKEFELQSNSQYREYVQQQVRTINRYDIAEEALARLGPGAGAFGARGEPLRHTVERLQGALEITPIPDTYQISVTLQGKSGNGLAETVNSVVKTFLEKAKKEEFYASDQRIADLANDREKLQTEVANKQEQRTALAQELGVTTFTENFLNPYDKLLVDAKVALADSMRQRIQTDASLASVDAKQRPDGDRALSALAQDMASKDAALTSLQANMNQRRAGLLTATSGMQPDHPGRKAVERELADLDQERNRVYQALLNEYSGMLLEERKADAFKTSEIETRLKAQVAEQESRAAWFTTKYQQGMSFGLDIDRARKRLNSIEDRLDFLSLEGRAPGFARLFSAARSPEAPVKGGRKPLFGIVLLASLMIGLLMPIGADFLDPRLHLPGQVEKILGFGLMGWVLDKEDAGRDFAQEQIFRLASRISQDHQAKGSRIFAFTGVKSGAGTTSIVTGTALALTRLGAPALAVEANAYRGDGRYRSPDERGLTVLLRGTHGIDSAIVPGSDDFPDCMPVGELHNERSLPDILNLINLLKASEGTYDFVLIDLPPLLVSADAEIIARSADVTVLIVEAETTTRVELQKAARALERIQPGALGAILNRVKGDAGGGFGRRALHEFKTGVPAPRGIWSSPWLWR